LTDLKKYLLLILTALLVVVTCNIYRYSKVNGYCISYSDIGKTYFENNAIEKFDLYESKLADLDLYKNVKYDIKLLVKAEWIKSVLSSGSYLSCYSFLSYTIKLNNKEIFKDFLMIYPFNYFF